MKIHYFEKGWELKAKYAKQEIKDKPNVDFRYKIDEYYLKSDVDKYIKELKNEM